MAADVHLIIVDDEPEIRDLCQRYLEPHGFRVSTAASGQAMRQILAREAADLVILDVVLPGEGGLEIARWLRETSDLAIIMLTGKGEMVDRVVGLEMGADDYVTKPFELRELLARVRSVLRRTSGERNGGEAAEVARFAGWALDLAARRLVASTGQIVQLTTAEYDLLITLINNPKRVLSRDRLMDLARDRDRDSFDRSIDVLVHRLRRKIEADAAKPELIKTVRGGGYIFTANVTRA